MFWAIIVETVRFKIARRRVSRQQAASMYHLLSWTLPIAAKAPA